MSMTQTHPVTQIADASEPHSMAGEFVSLGEALKLISPCSCEKKDVLSFTSNVDAAFEVMEPNRGNKLYKFLLLCICGEPRTAIAHRNLDSLAEV
jgi:hypothetical protein